MSDPGDWGLLDPVAESSPSTSDDAVLAALVEVERALTRAWSEVGSGDSPEFASAGAEALDAGSLDRSALIRGARQGGVPVIPLVTQLRRQAEAAAPGAGAWVHRGATSQDILDTALVVVAAAVFRSSTASLITAAQALAVLADAEQSTLMVGRTLGQHAAPLTAGVVVSGWLDGISTALELVSTVAVPVQLGGAVGTGESFDVLAGSAVHPELRAAFAEQLGLDDPGRSWAAERSPVLGIAAAAATTVAALGKIGRDLASLSRTELGEFALGSSGGSSAMPQKQNPVDAVLLTAAGLRAPGLLASIHSSAVSIDQRPAGEWHAEWLPLRELLRLCEQSSAVAATALAGLRVDRAAVARNLAITGDAIFSERVSLGGVAGDPAPTRDAARRIVTAATSRFEAVVTAARGTRSSP